MGPATSPTDGMQEPITPTPGPRGADRAGARPGRRAQRADTAAPPPHPLASYLDGLHRKHASCSDGEVASYIPELTLADPAWFGIVVATIDGRLYAAGDTEQTFTIQSISKPLVYALALQDSGVDGVLDKIGVEPTGDAFNSISLYTDSGRPYNPMINAGAIAATGLVRGADQDEKLARILDLFSRCAGRPLEIDEDVYRSERDTGFRNFAIGYMLRNFGIVSSAPEPILDLYFKQCSILVTCRDLAVIAATLANGGVCPLTGQVAIASEHVPRVLSVMASCGMYDYAGEWIYRIGMPSKSGVGGGIIGVLPGHMGISVFSPPLDARGNSVRGIRVFNDFSQDFGLHLFQTTRAVRSIVRRCYNAASVTSKRVRRSAEAATLAANGQRIIVYELQGELTLFSVERVMREILALPPRAGWLIIDLRRIFGVDLPALNLWLGFLATVRGRFEDIVLTHSHDNESLAGLIADAEADAGPSPSPFRTVENTDAALEACEEALLASIGGLERLADDEGVMPLQRFDICEGLDGARISVLLSFLEARRYDIDEVILKRGDPADSLFFLIRGQVSVSVELEGGGSRRLSTCTPGMLFGEMALLERRPRSATVVADGAVECYVLPIDNFDRLTASHPDLKVKLLENFAKSLSLRVRKLTEEVRAMSD